MFKFFLTHCIHQSYAVGVLVRYRLWWLAGAAALGLILGLIIFPLWTIFKQVEIKSLSAIITDPYIGNVVRFSLWQAFLSTILSIGLAIPAAHSIARQTKFIGRSYLLRMLSISLVIPTIVAVYGIVAIFGNNGWLRQSFEFIGSEFSVYGLTGILIAHTFFNLPLSIRVLLQALEDIPSSNWRLAGQLGIGSYQNFLLIQWPVIKKVLPGLVLLVFSLCFTSFAIVMTLGGGPAATTIEVAIYQALRFDFDINQASTLALIQLFICLAIIVLISSFGKSTLISNSRTIRYHRQDGQRLPAKCSDVMIILLVLLFVISPMIAIVYSGMSNALLSMVQTAVFWNSVSNSLVVSILAGLLAVITAYALVGTSVVIRAQIGWHWAARVVEMSGSIILFTPPLVLGTGLFLLLRDYTDIFSVAIPLAILINALMGLPFAIRIIEQPFLQLFIDHNKLCESLDIKGWNRFFISTWPILRKPIALALAFSSTLAAGDLTVIALFGSDDIKTLPYLLYQLMGSYRLEAAAAAAFCLLAFCLSLFWFIEFWVGGRNEQNA